MGIGAWNPIIQLQFITFKILIYKISKQKQYKKYAHLFQRKSKIKKSKQFNLYGKLRKEKSNFESN